MYCDLWLQYIQVRKLFKGGNYSRKYDMWNFALCCNIIYLSLIKPESTKQFSSLWLNLRIWTLWTDLNKVVNLAVEMIETKNKTHFIAKEFMPQKVRKEELGIWYLKLDFCAQLAMHKIKLASQFLKRKS